MAALIEADFPTKLYYVPLRNSLFDTHVNQVAPHDRQLQYCSDAIAGFFQEMKRIGRADDVVIYVHSEFGRRVPENTSLGTDHGTAQVNFVIGNPVKGGMYGTPPSLTDLVLDGNLDNTTDFRQVYATLVEMDRRRFREGAGPEVQDDRHVPRVAPDWRTHDDHSHRLVARTGVLDRRPRPDRRRRLELRPRRAPAGARRLRRHAAEIQKLADVGLERAVRSLVHYERHPESEDAAVRGIRVCGIRR